MWIGLLFGAFDLQTFVDAHFLFFVFSIALSIFDQTFRNQTVIFAGNMGTCSLWRLSLGLLENQGLMRLWFVRWLHVVMNIKLLWWCLLWLILWAITLNLYQRQNFWSNEAILRSIFRGKLKSFNMTIIYLQLAHSQALFLHLLLLVRLLLVSFCRLSCRLGWR